MTEDGDRRAPLHPDHRFIPLSGHRAPFTLLTNKTGDNDYLTVSCQFVRVPSMHACLQVDEIVRIIAYELVSSQGRTSAVALACCCRSFEDPALDALWETQHLLTPLLKTFPEDVRNEGDSECNVSAQATYVVSSLNYFTRKYFKRLPTSQELARFRKYAGRMRDFSDTGSLDDLSPEVFLVLQRFSFNEPLLPNLKTLQLWSATVDFAPFILLFISPGTSRINIIFETYNLSIALIASVITIFPARCPNLQHIGLHSLPRDPMITNAVSELLLTTNRNTLRTFDVDSPLTEEARGVVHRLPDLRYLTVVTGGGTSLPSLMLPSLTKLLIIEHDHDHDWLDWMEMFYGATLGKLETVNFAPESEQIGDFLGAFERAALAASVQNALSNFVLYTRYSWDPKLSSLLSFTQMKTLSIHFPCDRGCYLRVGDDDIINLARAMPELEILRLGDRPCRRIPTGVTAKGLAVLAHHCPNLSVLCIHFQVASLTLPPATFSMTPKTEPAVLLRGCALKDLTVGEIPIPEQSVLMVALTLVRIFPRIENVIYDDAGWQKVRNVIYLSNQVANCSSKQHPFATCWGNLKDASSGAIL